MTLSRREILFAVYSVVLFLAMASPIQAVIEFAMDTENSHASQILLIPFITAALLYINRKNIFQRVAYSPLPGGILAGFGIAALIAGNTWGMDLPEQDRLALVISSLVLFWLAGFLFFYGTASFRTALFPLLFLAFCIPIPSALLDRVITFLQHGSADMAFGILKLSGTPVYREGVTIALPNLVIEVAPQCSGIRSGIALFIMSLLGGHLFLRSLWRRSVLLLIAIPILLLKNALRIGTLSLLAVHVDPRILTSRLHQEGGIPFFILGLLLIYPVLAILVRSEKKRLGTPAERAPFFSAITREADL